MSPFQRIDAWFGRVYGAVGALVGVTIGLFAVAISLDLALRLFEVGNLPGMQDIVEYLLFTGVFLAAPWVLRLNAHVRVDLFIGGLSGRAAMSLERALDVAGCIVSLVLIRYGFENMASAWMQGSIQRQQFDIPEWPMLAIFTASFVLLALEFVFRIVRAGPAPEAEQGGGGGF